MSGKQYWLNKLPALLLNLLGVLALAVFLLAVGNSIQTVLWIAFVWLLLLAVAWIVRYESQKKRLDKLLSIAESLEERYLLPEVMEIPGEAGEHVYYRLLKMAEKSMLERIGQVERERKEYKEYIEQWIHEVKTPMTAMKLLCENHRSPFTRAILAELENVNRFTEQALYYTRSELFHP